MQELDQIQEDYIDNELPTPPYVITESVEEVDNDARSAFEDEDAPPSYSGFDESKALDLIDNEAEVPPTYSQSLSPTRPESDDNVQKLPRIKPVQFSQSSMKPPNRMQLLFNALVQRKNNDAGWLGTYFIHALIHFTHNIVSRHEQ